MSKISTYEVAPVPKLADKLIGTSVGGEIEDVTYNFTLQELLDVFLPVIPANNLQGVLDYGNTATQDINLFGTITTTNLEVVDTANLFITYLNEETHIVGGLFDSEDSIGLAGQVLTSTGEFVEWVTLPPIFTPNLQQVLDIGNTSDTGIILDAGLEALDVDTDTATINTNITIDGTITDGDASVGAAGTVLSSTVTGVKWVALPVYSATSPLLFNSATGVFSIQQANGSQSGFLSSSDWITFNGKQNAGNYITALTGEATASGPGSATVTLGNAAVIGKVLTGFNPIAGTINASDSILTAFGKTQSQINALVGGVQYQGVWNASTNVPTLVSSVGVQGHYYVVNVAGNTNLNGITDWQIGDWAIFSESVWQKVDNTESVTSVNGFTGAVSLTTDNIPEGTTNLYFLNSRARTALSFAAGSGAYNNVTGVITIPTDNNQILNGANYITLGSLSATTPLTYNNLTGVFSIPQATSLVNGYLSATDWTTFNSKQNYLNGTGLVKSTAGTISYITDNSTNWNTAYDRSIVSAAVTGTTTKTLTLNEQDGNTITASWTDLDTGLTSVGVSMPSAFTVSNSPLTSNGTIAITGAGTNLQYIDGTGALQTFPGLTGFVPYTGATANVDLGTFGLISDYLRLNITPSSIPTTVGTMSWNNSDGTMDIRLKGGNVTLQVGEETVVRVVNKSGVDLLEANYQVVRVRNEAEGGAQGQRLAVVLARANTKVNHTGLLGIVTETINSNQEGFVTNFGIVRDIDTTGDLQGETWVDGDVLWLSETTAGALTNIEPTTHPIQIGYVIYAHANNGKIFVYLQEGVDELDELHDVSITSVANNQGLFYDSATSLWKNKSIATALGYTPADAATTLTINGTTYDLSANRTWSVGTVTSVAALTLGTTGTDLSSSVATGTTTPVITLNVPTASAANRGALSAADWSTFNTKVGSVTASSPLASSGGSTPNITIQQSSGSQDGYLSSTDWTTFNNKQAAGNYITSLTGEATATGPGAAAVTLNNASVTAKVLTGINITGGTVQATDTMLTAFGKLQNQINGLIGSTIYQGTWNASTNTPALASGVGVRGYYYIVSVAGNTNLDGITDWFVGDWAIFDGTAWQQVDNTDAVVSVNGQTGAVSLTTDNIPEGATNQYYLDSRARAALSFTAGSGAYNSTTGVITIPTNTNQLTNGASFITLASLSGTAPIQYNNTTGAISITQAGTASNGFLSSTDWNTFNNKQPAGSYVTLTGVETLSNKSFSNVVNLSVNGYILAGATGVNPLQMYSTTLTSNFLFSSNSFGTNINNDLFYSKNSSNRSVLSFNNTAERTYTFPNTTGTIALTSDIPSLAGYVTLDTTQTLTGFKTFSAPIAGGSGDYIDLTSAPLKIVGTNNIWRIPHTSTSATQSGVYNYEAGKHVYWGEGTDGGDYYFRGRNFKVTSDAENFSVSTLGAAYVRSTLQVGGVAITGNSNSFYNAATETAVAIKQTSGDGQVALSLWNNGTTGENRFTRFFTEGTATLRGTIQYDRTTDKLNIIGNGGGLLFTGVATFSNSLTTSDLSASFLSPSLGTNQTVFLELGKNIADTYNCGEMSFKFVSSGSSSNMVSLGFYGAGNKLNVLGNGNVGIGTTTIGGRLDVQAAGTSSWTYYIRNAAGGYGGGIYNTGGNNSQLYLATSAGTDNVVIAASGDSFLRGGNLGINTTTPIGRLTIYGDYSGGSGDYTNMTNPSYRIQAVTTYWRIAYLSGSGSISGVYNYETGKDVYWGEPSDTGNYWFRGRTLVVGSSGISGGGALQVNGNVNINGVFQINGVTIGGGGGSGVTGSGTTNYVTKWTGASTIGNSGIYDAGGIIGIGTSSPAMSAGASQGLNISNSTYIQLRLTSTAESAGMEFYPATGDRYEVQASNSNQWFVYNRTTASYRFTIHGNGNATIGGNTDSGYKLQVNGTSIFTGAATFSSSVTATGGFFDTSDSRLKIIVKDYKQPKGIENVVARMYVKNGKQELGYYAQDLQEILPSAVIEGNDGFLGLSYSQVHTAKIAVIESEIDILKNKVSELEFKLQKYEA